MHLAHLVKSAIQGAQTDRTHHPGADGSLWTVRLKRAITRVGEQRELMPLSNEHCLKYHTVHILIGTLRQESRPKTSRAGGIRCAIFLLQPKVGASDSQYPAKNALPVVVELASPRRYTCMQCADGVTRLGSENLSPDHALWPRCLQI